MIPWKFCRRWSPPGRKRRSDQIECLEQRLHRRVQLLGVVGAKELAAAVDGRMPEVVYRLHGRGPRHGGPDNRLPACLVIQRRIIIVGIRRSVDAEGHRIGRHVLVGDLVDSRRGHAVRQVGEKIVFIVMHGRICQCPADVVLVRLAVILVFTFCRPRTRSSRCSNHRSI